MCGVGGMDTSIPGFNRWLELEGGMKVGVVENCTYAPAHVEGGHPVRSNFEGGGFFRMESCCRVLIARARMRLGSIPAYLGLVSIPTIRVIA
jgi:hypothetical protein